MSIDQKQVQRWGLCELEFVGPSDGNPFVEVSLTAEFRYQHRVLRPEGFYDGEGVYRVRFMPDMLGEWEWETHSNCAELDGQHGSLMCVPPTGQNHGPVHVRDTYHFVYADGTPHFSVGTTCYAWAHQGDALEEQTLATLAEAPFNKLRMCVFPKDYTYNQNEPMYYAYERKADGAFNWERFNPAFWQHFERRVGQLCELGIEADLILFHCYDRWGFQAMGSEANDRYLRYCVARLAAYRNVWWSMANEFDLMKAMDMSDWDHFFKIVQAYDPYQHLRSVHNCRGFYDHGKPWVTHCSVQHSDLERVAEWRKTYGKPVVVDECRYEGNLPQLWGSISALELVNRFWLGTIGGGYVGHGETYLHPEDILWWSKGGVLHGESAPRIAFLRKLLEEGPGEGLEPFGRGACVEGRYYLYYWSIYMPARWDFDLPGGPYRAELIDPWEMTITPYEGTYEGAFRLALPGKPYQAIRFVAV